MSFGAEAAIVHHNCNKPQAVTNGGVKISTAHHERAITYRGHCSPCRLRKGHANSGGQPDTDALECVVEYKGLWAVNVEVLAGESELVAGIHHDSAISGQHAIEGQQGVRTICACQYGSAR